MLMTNQNNDTENPAINFNESLSKPRSMSKSFSSGTDPDRENNLLLPDKDLKNSKTIAVEDEFQFSDINVHKKILEKIKSNVKMRSREFMGAAESYMLEQQFKNFVEGQVMLPCA